MIQITKTIEKMLSCCKNCQTDEILKRAWDSCCDGEYLKAQGIQEDLWNGRNEQARIVFEREAVRNVIFQNDLWIIDSDFLDIEY